MRITKIVTIFIIIFIFCNIFCKSFGVCNTVTLEKNVSAVRLTLSDNTVLYDIRLKKEINDISVISEDVIKKCNIIFIVDTDSSAESKLGTIQSNLKDFSDKLYSDTYYSRAKEKLHIAFLAMDNSEPNKAPSDLIEINMQGKNKDTYEDDIDNINNQKYNLIDALSIATNSFDEFNADSGAGNDDMTQLLIFITDGVNDENIDESKVVINDLTENMMILTYGIIIGNDTVLDRLFESPYITLLKTPVWADVINFLNNNIKNDIQIRAINSSFVIPQGVTNGALVLPNEIQLYVDQEIMHGALLEIEYTITSTSISYVGAPITTIIADTFSEEDFKYEPNQKLLTKPGRNKDEGWTRDSITKKLICNPNGKNEIKLVLSTTLSNEQFNDEGYINTVESFTSTNGVNIATSAKSMRVKVVPPFGEEKTEEIIGEKIDYKLIVFIIILFCTIILLTLKKKKKKTDN